MNWAVMDRFAAQTNMLLDACLCGIFGTAGRNNLDSRTAGSPAQSLSQQLWDQSNVHFSASVHVLLNVTWAAEAVPVRQPGSEEYFEAELWELLLYGATSTNQKKTTKMEGGPEIYYYYNNDDDDNNNRQSLSVSMCS